MKSRSMRVRTKVVALLVSLIALWGFAAFVTADEGLNLLWVNTLDKKFGRPTDTLVVALQQERRLSAMHLGDDSQHGALQAQRARTDEAVATFRELAQDTDVRLAASAQAEQRVAETFAQLDKLGATRQAVDAGSIGRERAVADFTDIINAGFRIYGSLATLDDPAVAKDGRTLVSLNRAREVFSQEDALLAGALVAGRITSTEHARFVELVGTQRYLLAEADAELPPGDHDRYQQLESGAAMTQVRTLEDLVIKKGGGRAPFSAATWTAAVEPAFAELRDLVVAGVNDLVDRATPAAAGVILRLALAGGLGLIAVIASIIMSITTARALVAQLEKLRQAASDLATKRLPSVVDRLRRGEKVDVEAEAPPLAFGADEIGQVGQAFNAVQQTAIAAAVQQAQLRDSVRDLFLGLARRNQALVHRQLRMLDVIERRETDPQELADIFRVDHLATRMRRNAENLIVLSGATPGRRWRKPVPMVDVLRGAVAEVEDYTRVTVTPIEEVSLAGRAVSDVIHLLAELIENGTSFSPPYTNVQVGGQLVANGFVVEIEDRGLGMSETELAEANEVIRNPPDFNLSSTVRLGLYVVGRLAQRHGLDVRLRRSPYGGITAIVLIPRAMVVGGDDETEAADEVTGPQTVAVGVATVETRHDHSAGELSSPADATDGSRRGPSDLSPPSRRGPRTAFRAEEVPPEDEAAPSKRAESSVAPPRSPEPVAAGEAPTAAATAHAVARTPSGLPSRVRQASLAPGLRNADRAPDAPAANSGRTPEQIRDMMASYQKASLRGRADANRSLEAVADDVPPAADSPASGGAAGPGADDRL